MSWQRQMQLIGQSFREANELERCRITVGTQTLDVVVARTPQQWALGMTADLPPNIDGMLFAMGSPSTVAFHMAGVSFPILIAFFDGTGSLLHADLMEAHTGRSRSMTPFAYALELTGPALDPTILKHLQDGLRIPIQDSG